MIERAEKQIILARHARRLLNYVDDTPVVPGDTRQAYEHEQEARHVLEDAENDLRAYRLSLEPVVTLGEQETHIDGARAAEQESVANGDDTESMRNGVPSSKKQLEEPQASQSEAQTIPLAS